MGIVYVGVGLFGALGATLRQTADGSVWLSHCADSAGPADVSDVAAGVFRDSGTNREKGLFPDGLGVPPPDLKLKPTLTQRS